MALKRRYFTDSSKQIIFPAGGLLFKPLLQRALHYSAKRVDNQNKRIQSRIHQQPDCYHRWPLRTICCMRLVRYSICSPSFPPALRHSPNPRRQRNKPPLSICAIFQVRTLSTLFWLDKDTKKVYHFPSTAYHEEKHNIVLKNERTQFSFSTVE